MDMQEQSKMRLYHEKMPDNLKPVSLWEFIERYREQRILKPPHQRGPVWDKAKETNWYKTLKKENKLDSTFVTYQLQQGDQYSAVYLNDGGNRAWYTNKFFENCQEHGLTCEEAKQRLRAIDVAVSHRYFATHMEAVQNFHDINSTTHLTEMEKNAFHLAYLPEHVGPLLQRAMNIVAQAEKFLMPRFADTRESDRFKRDVYALILRLMDKERERRDYHVTGKGPSVEYQLKIKIESMTASELEQLIVMFERNIENETQLITSVWKQYTESTDCDAKTNATMSRALFRFVLHAGLTRRNTRNASIELHQKWLFDFFRISTGRSQILTDDGRSITLSLGRLSNFGAIAAAIGHWDYANILLNLSPGNTRKRLRSQPPGIHNSHVLPFKTNGNGRTVPEPALLNLARGARPMEAA